ncbi:hypothetical protein [Chelativorans sp.]|uniref:hypothetical protein n=1 Tax=Chelativorans sp. TaxID=2203393 RepID=UPI0028110A14|nr:hypothetical protein [Chelativorans sp.]
MSTARYALYSGTMAGLASLLAVMASAKSEGRGVLQPVNATSHWLHGDKAGAVANPDIRHTGVGFVTHALSAMFWAVPFAIWLSRRSPRSLPRLIGEASALSAFAALFDYGVVPRRLTPGWELAVSKRAVAGAFVAMALGLAAGAWAAQRRS